MSNYKVIIRTKAKLELRKIYDWYEEKQERLGTEFLQEAFKVIDDLPVTIVEHRQFIKEVRIVEIERFPYYVFYIKNENKKHISIIAVLGEKQDMITHIQQRTPK